MRILAIDPGPSDSAFVLFDGAHILDHGHEPNAELLRRLDLNEFAQIPDLTVIEQIEAMGMSVGASVFETVFWSGRLAQMAGRFERVTRRTVKLHLCGSMRAKDGNIRQALIDHFGGVTAIGTKKAKGPLHGITGHKFAALAVAVTWWDQNAGKL